MSIPEARGRLRAIAETLELDGDEDTAAQIRDVIAMMFRSHHGPISRRRSPVSITPEMLADMVAMKLSNPDLMHREIGAKFGVDGGRVSEALKEAKERAIAKVFR